MAIITNYVCDVSGKQGNKEDFFEVKVVATPSGQSAYYTTQIINKIIHKDVAEKLHLLKINDPVKNPEPTLESKLAILLKEYVTEIAYEAGGEAGSEAASNYNRG